MLRGGPESPCFILATVLDVSIVNAESYYGLQQVMKNKNLVKRLINWLVDPRATRACKCCLTKRCEGLATRRWLSLQPYGTTSPSTAAESQIALSLTVNNQTRYGV